MTSSASVELPDAGVALSVHGRTANVIIDQGVKMFHAREGTIKAASRFFYDICVSSSVEQTALALSDDGRILALADDDGRVCVLALHNFELLFRGSVHTQGVTDISLSADGRLACSTARDRLAIVWDTHTGQVVQTIRSISAGHTEAKTKRLSGRRSVRVLRFANSTGLLFAGESSKEGGWVSVWRHQGESGSAAEPYVACSVSRACSDALTGLTVDHTGRLIAVSSSEGHISVLRWDNVSLTRVWSSETVLQNFRSSNPPHALPVTGMCFSSSGRFLVAASADRSITVWDNHARYRAGLLPWVLVVGFALIIVVFTVWIWSQKAVTANILAGDNHKLKHVKRIRFRRSSRFGNDQPYASNEDRGSYRERVRRPRSTPWIIEPDDICIAETADNAELTVARSPFVKDRKPMRKSVEQKEPLQKHNRFRRDGLHRDKMDKNHIKEDQLDSEKTGSPENVKMGLENYTRKQESSVRKDHENADIREQSLEGKLTIDSYTTSHNTPVVHPHQESVLQASLEHRTRQGIEGHGKTVHVAKGVCETCNESVLKKDSRLPAKEAQRHPIDGNIEISISSNNENSLAEGAAHKRVVQSAVKTNIEEPREPVNSRVEGTTLPHKHSTSPRFNDFEDGSEQTPNVFERTQLGICPRQIGRWDRLVQGWTAGLHSEIDQRMEKELMNDPARAEKQLNGEETRGRDILEDAGRQLIDDIKHQSVQSEKILTYGSPQSDMKKGRTLSSPESGVSVCRRKRIFRRATTWFTDVPLLTGLNPTTSGAKHFRHGMGESEVDHSGTSEHSPELKSTHKIQYSIAPSNSLQVHDNAENVLNSIMTPAPGDLDNSNRQTMNKIELNADQIHTDIKYEDDRNEVLFTSDTCLRREWMYWEQTEDLCLADVELMFQKRRPYSLQSSYASLSADNWY